MRYGNYSEPVALSDMLQQDFEPAEMAAGYRRGMVLKVYKAKILELIGCDKDEFNLYENIVPYRFEVEGCMLKVESLKEIDTSGLTEDQRLKRRSLLNGLKGASLKPEDHQAKDYDNPTLVVYFRSGSMWSTELHHRRYQLKMLLNKRLKCDFIKQVIIK